MLWIWVAFIAGCGSSSNFVAVSDNQGPATPANGPNSGGTAVTLRGKNLTGTTSVTVAGRNADFAVNSSTELLFNTQSYTGTGFVKVVVTTPSGSATTNFDYTDLRGS